MASKYDRFIKTYGQGVLETTEIWVDKKTGVNYLWHTNGSAGGLTVMLNPDGTPVITPVPNKYDE